MSRREDLSNREDRFVKYRRRARAWARWFGFPVLSLAGLALALYGVVMFRVAFDYARSMEKPTVEAFRDVPVAKRAFEFMAVSAVNAVSKFPTDAKAPIPTVQLAINPEELSLLNTREAKAMDIEVGGSVFFADEWRQADVSLRGDNIFHWGADLKSYSLKFKKNARILNQEELNLINPKDAAGFSMLFGEHTGTRLGLLTPGTTPCRFLLNGHNQGLYLCQQETNESWIRQNDRVPGDVYVGDYLVYGYGSDLKNAKKLWHQPGLWKQKAAVSGVGETRADLDEFLKTMSAIVKAPADADPEPLFDRLERIADVDAFLRLWVVQTWANSIHQDEFHNWRLYFDPSSGRFEPIVWDTLRVWDGDSKQALDAPLPRPQLALYRFPELNQKRYEILYHELIKPELEKGVSRSYAQRFAEKTQSTLLAADSVDRMDWVPNVLMWHPVSRFKAIADQKAEVERMVPHAKELAAELDGIEIQKAHCAPKGRSRLNCAFSLESPAAIRLVSMQGGKHSLPLKAEPGKPKRYHVGEGPGTMPAFYPVRGTTTVKGYPPRLGPRIVTAYQYFSIPRDDFSSADVALTFENLVTGRARTVTFAMSDGLNQELRNENIYSFHPRLAEALKPIVLGPGKRVVRESIISKAGQAVHVRPGTELLMAPGVSIVARGQLIMAGEPGKPVAIRRLHAERPWGGVFVLGDQADGSSLRHCDIAGGSIAEYGLVQIKGMVEIAHVDDLVMEQCRIADNSVGDDALHLLGVSIAKFDAVTIEGARADCTDLDYVTGTISRYTARSCGNDGLDLMSSAIEITGAELVDCGDKGASVGENSAAWFESAFLARNNIGVQVKDHSQAYLKDGAVFVENGLDVSAYKKSNYYDAGGCVVAEAREGGLSTSIRDASKYVEASSIEQVRGAWSERGKGGSCWLQ